MAAVVSDCLARGGNVSRLLSPTGQPLDRFDAHQINITYFSALGGDEDAYLLARGLQLFAPGIPQVYYVGLLAGENDLAGVEATGEGRAINRRNYSEPEVEDAMRRPVVRRLLELVRLRAGHLAFLGEPEVTQEGASALSIAWRNGPHRARLTGDLAARRAVVEWTAADGRIARRDLTSFSSAQTSPLQDPDQPASSPAQPGRPPGLP